MSYPRSESPAADDAATRAISLPSADAPRQPPPLDVELAELRRQGAKAAVRGETRQSNPMFDSINQPDATGESKQVWSRRSEAWEHGHTSQRSGAVSPPGAAGSTAADDHAADEALFGVTRVLTFAGSRHLNSASGFFFERDARLFLVTSRHALLDAPSGHSPDRIEIEVRTNMRDLTQLAAVSILLHRDGPTAWHQGHDSGGAVDVAALELERSALPMGSVVRAFGPQHLAVGFDRFEVGDRLAIPGFPLGFFDTVHHLPVVRQASIASHYGMRFQGVGIFLTDARMQPGTSGSPVLARVDSASADQPRWWLLGVHSSRMDMVTRDTAHDESLGLNCAWYADVLMAMTSGRR